MLKLFFILVISSYAHCFTTGDKDLYGKYPNVYRLRVKDKMTNKCTATLISRKIILTAHHCFIDIDKKRVKDVTLNGQRLLVDSLHFVDKKFLQKMKHYKQSIREAKKKLEGEDYSKRSKELFPLFLEFSKNDIALIKLKSDAPENFLITQVSLEEPSERDLVVSVGFGGIPRKRDFIPNYRLSTIHILERGIIEIATFNKMDRITLPGDSGGPLIDRVSNKQLGVLYGSYQWEQRWYSVYAPLHIHSKYIRHFLK